MSLQKIDVSITTSVNAVLSVRAIEELLLIPLQREMKERGISKYEVVFLDKYCHQCKMTAEGETYGEHQYEGQFTVNIGEAN